MVRKILGPEDPGIRATTLFSWGFTYPPGSGRRRRRPIHGWSACGLGPWSRRTVRTARLPGPRAVPGRSRPVLRHCSGGGPQFLFSCTPAALSRRPVSWLVSCWISTKRSNRSGGSGSSRVSRMRAKSQVVLMVIMGAIVLQPGGPVAVKAGQGRFQPEVYSPFPPVSPPAGFPVLPSFHRRGPRSGNRRASGPVGAPARRSTFSSFFSHSPAILQPFSWHQ